MLDLLTSLEKLLRNHGHYGQANVIECLRDLYGSDPAAFTKLCQGIELGGGSGAVWECTGFGQDEMAFRLGVIALADEMKASGIETERSAFIASTFRKRLLKAR